MTTDPAFAEGLAALRREHLAREAMIAHFMDALDEAEQAVDVIRDVNGAPVAWQEEA